MGNTINPKSFINYNLELGGLGKVIEGAYKKETTDAPKTTDQAMEIVDKVLDTLPEELANTKETEQIRKFKEITDKEISQTKPEQPLTSFSTYLAKTSFGTHLKFITKKAFESMANPQSLAVIKLSDLSIDDVNYLGTLKEITSHLYENGTTAAKMDHLWDHFEGKEHQYNELTDNKNRQLLKRMELLVGSEEGGNDHQFSDTIKEMRMTMTSPSLDFVTDNERITSFAEGIRDNVDSLLTTVVTHPDQLGFQLSDPKLNDRAKESLKGLKEKHDRDEHLQQLMNDILKM